jgi:hypothetical protein
VEGIWVAPKPAHITDVGETCSHRWSNHHASRRSSATITTVALTGHGRKALDAYTQALRNLLGGL